jgi:hypothetical protein
MFTKTAVAALAALTLTAGVVTTSGEAQAGWKGFGPALGLGIAAGIVAGAAYATTAPGYYVSAPAGCRWVARYDAWGNYRGSVKLCDLY